MAHLASSLHTLMCFAPPVSAASTVSASSSCVTSVIKALRGAGLLEPIKWEEREWGTGEGGGSRLAEGWRGMQQMAVHGHPVPA